MKLALVIESFNRQGGGAERSTAQIAEELIRRGHQVTILTGACPDADSLPGATILPLASRKSASTVRLLRFAWWARRCLARDGFDSSLSMTMAVPAAVLQPRGGTVRETLLRNLARRTGPKARLTKQLFQTWSLKHQVQLVLEHRTLSDPRVTRIAAVSRYVVDQLQRHYGLDGQKIELVPNAAVVADVGNQQKQSWRCAIRRAFGVPEEALVYLFVAQNPPLKGFEPLLRATGRLKGLGVEAMLLLAGPFNYREQQQVSRLGLRNQVRFIASTATMAPVYAAADVTVHPTFYDPSSKVVIESLMMGTPAISTIFNGSSEFIKPDGAPPRGRVIEDPADADSLAAAMADLADPEQRRHCSQAMKGLISTLSMRKHVDRLEQLLAEST